MSQPAQFGVAGDGCVIYQDMGDSFWNEFCIKTWVTIRPR